MLTTKKAYLFDVDGVLTNPEAKKVVELEIFDEIIKRLTVQCSVGLNTGRSLEFILKEVVSPIETMIKDKSVLKNIYAIGEKGTVWMTCDEKGEKKITVDQAVSIPVEIKEQIRLLVNQPQFKETMFYDETKQTMVTAELRPGKTILEFEEPRDRFAEKLKEIMENHPRGHEFRIESTCISIDVENKFVGKALGAKRFVMLLQEKDIEPEGFICFGDSVSDYDMHEELVRLGKNSKFVFVGDKARLIEKDLKDVVFTNNCTDKGTLEYLKVT